MMLYYKGCTAAEKIPEIADATEYILQKAGIKYHTIENEKCCGSVLLRTGFKNEAIEQMKENVNQLKEFGRNSLFTTFPQNRLRRSNGNDSIWDLGFGI